MSDFKIVSIGGGEYDLDLSNNDLVIVGATEDTWPEEVAQRLVYRLGAWLGECSFDRSVGFPWLDGVFGRAPLDGIAALVHETIVNTPGVEGLDDEPILLLDTVARKLSISVKVRGAGFVVPIELEVKGPAL